MNAKVLIRISGALNLVFGAFHVFLGFWICRMPGIPEFPFAVMKMLNTALTGAFLYMGVSMLFFAGEVAVTKIGRLLLLLGVTTFLIRGIEEVALAPKPGVPILAVCLIAAIVHALALYRSPGYGPQAKA